MLLSVFFSRSVAAIVIFKKKKNLLMNVTIAVAETDTFEVMTAGSAFSAIFKNHNRLKLEPILFECKSASGIVVFAESGTLLSVLQVVL